MTTIVVTDTEIAWDSALVCDGVRSIIGKPKVQTFSGVIVGATGDATPLEVFARWGAEFDWHPDHKPDGDWEIVVIDKHGCRLLGNEDVGFVSIHPPFALGSGGNIALGAVLALQSVGVTENLAGRACHIAASTDSNTMEPIHTLNYVQVLRTKRQRNRPKARTKRS